MIVHFFGKGERGKRADEQVGLKNVFHLGTCPGAQKLRVQITKKTLRNTRGAVQFDSETDFY